MTKRIKTYIIIFTLTFLLLTLFYGLYLLIRVKYASYPQDVYYFEGGTPANGQILVLGFSNFGVIVESLIISLIVTMLNHFIKIKNIRPFAFSLKLTFLVTVVYLLYKVVPAINFDHGYFDIFLQELIAEILVLAVLFFVCSVLTIALISKFKK